MSLDSSAKSFEDDFSSSFLISKSLNLWRNLMIDFEAIRQKKVETDYHVLSYSYSLLQLHTCINSNNLRELKIIKRIIKRHEKSIKLYLGDCKFSNSEELEKILIQKGFDINNFNKPD